MIAEGHRTACNRFGCATVKPILFAFHLPLLGEVTFPAYFTLLTLGFALRGVDHLARVEAHRARPGAHPRHQPVDDRLGRHRRARAAPRRRRPLPRVRRPVRQPEERSRRSTRWSRTAPPTRSAATTTCATPRATSAIRRRTASPPSRSGAAGSPTTAASSSPSRSRSTSSASTSCPSGASAIWRAPAISLGLFFGRMGCYLNGCCYGKETTSRRRRGLPARQLRVARAARRRPHHAPIRRARRPPDAALRGAGLPCHLRRPLLTWSRPRKRRDGDVLAGFLDPLRHRALGDRGLPRRRSRRVPRRRSRPRRSSRSRSSPSGLWIWWRRGDRSARPPPPPRADLADDRGVGRRRSASSCSGFRSGGTGGGRLFELPGDGSSRKRAPSLQATYCVGEPSMPRRC